MRSAIVAATVYNVHRGRHAKRRRVEEFMAHRPRKRWTAEDREKMKQHLLSIGALKRGDG